MKISPERLAAEAEATGFRPDVLEKVAQLLTLLNALRSHPFLGGKLALKGGTALNLFIFNVPRLSVDIDLNYIGTENRDGMLAERPTDGCRRNTPGENGLCGMKAPLAGTATSKSTSISCSVSRYGR